jgi:hypothetical protein
MDAGKPPREATNAGQQSRGYSNQTLSKSSQRQQIQESIARPKIVGPGRVAKQVLRSEGVGRVQRDGSDGRGLSGSVETHAAHNTSFTLSRRCAPLATAGEVVSLE